MEELNQQLKKSIGQDITISRGDISKRKEKKSFVSGELFYDYITKDLWIGGGRGNQEVPMSIGGLNSIRWQGDWNESFLPTETLKVLPGYMYKCTKTIEASGYNEEILPNDLILYYEPKDKETSDELPEGKMNGKGVWIRINQTKAEAKNVAFDTTSLVDIPKAADSLQKAVSFLDRFKLGWGGDLEFAGDNYIQNVLKTLNCGKLYCARHDFKIYRTDKVWKHLFVKVTEDLKIVYFLSDGTVVQLKNNDGEDLAKTSEVLVDESEPSKGTIEEIKTQIQSEPEEEGGEPTVTEVVESRTGTYENDIEQIFDTFDGKKTFRVNSTFLTKVPNKVQCIIDYDVLDSENNYLRNVSETCSLPIINGEAFERFITLEVEVGQKIKINKITTKADLEVSDQSVQLTPTVVNRLYDFTGIYSDSTEDTLLETVNKTDLIYCTYKIPEGYTGGNDYEREMTLAEVKDECKEIQVIKVGDPLAKNVVYTITLDRASDMASAERAIEDRKNTKSVKDALDLLYTTKADLDKNNRVYLDQLPAFMFHGLHYMGLWDNGLTNSAWNPPEITYPNSIDPKVDRGFFWLWTGLNYEYVDQDGKGHIIRPGDMLISNSTITGGDIPGWEVYHRSDQVESEMGLMTESSTEEILRGVVKFRGIIRPTGTVETSVIHKGEVIYVVAPNTMLTPSESTREGMFYKETAPGSKEFVPASVQEVQKSINFEKDVKLIDTDGNMVTLQAGSLENQTLKDFIVKMPTASGTLITREQVEAEYAQANPTDGFLPSAYTNEKGFKKFRDSKVRDLEDGVAFVHKRAADGTVLSEVQFDMKAKMSNDKNVILNIPDHNGTLLNSRSLIDCYYWGKDVVTSLEAGMEEKIDEEEVQVTLATRDFVRETAAQIKSESESADTALSNKIDETATELSNKIDETATDLEEKIAQKKDEDNVKLSIVE